MNFPSATYRVQLNNNFTFKDLKKIIPYLHKLGVSTIYAAPITQATSGSNHGYDVIDPHNINEEIGTEEELRRIAVKLKSLEMNWLQDIVPNHMAFSTSNFRLMDVLERGPHSPYYRYFDINWNHHDISIKGKIMIPILGKELEECIEAGEIKVELTEKGAFVKYYDNEFPLSVKALKVMLSSLDNKEIKDGLKSLLSVAADADLETWEKFKAEIIDSIKNCRVEIEQLFERVNSDKALFKEVINNLYYKLSWWKKSEQEMNYRRFFTVNSLICLKMEESATFEEYHLLIKKLYDEGLIQGVRIDHIDGLYDPKGYVDKLRELMGKDCYIIAEKILEYNEDIAKDWELEGTSGYEFLTFTNRLLTNSRGAKKIEDYYKKLIPDLKPYKEIVFENKYNFLLSQMGGELDNLLHYLADLHLLSGSIEISELKESLAVFMACFPVYRIYPLALPLDEEALEKVNEAFEKAEKKLENKNGLDFIRTLFDPAEKAECKLKFVRRLMQFTGPLAAKGVEDTTFYVYNPLISHNEVGDSPETLSISIEEFHQKMVSRQKNNPFSLNATSTHDTKRGEDARMRLNVLSEIAVVWFEKLKQWNQINKTKFSRIDGKQAPSLNDTYFIYQSLLGSFPENYEADSTFIERSEAFITKALREAKVESNYTEPNEVYESACKNFIRNILTSSKFLTSFIPFLQVVQERANIYSTIQSAIKILAPGIPDIYQGSELLEISYVDPDNRRPVDYEFRQKLLENIIQKEKEGKEALKQFLEENKNKGALKLFITWKTLWLRRIHPDLFTVGEYVPLDTNGAEGHWLAFMRKYQEKCVIVTIPVCSTPDHQISLSLSDYCPGTFTNIFTGTQLHAKEIQAVLKAELKTFPIAVFLSEDIYNEIITE